MKNIEFYFLAVVLSATFSASPSFAAGKETTPFFRMVTVNFDGSLTKRISAAQVSALKKTEVAMQNRDWVRCATLSHRIFHSYQIYRSIQPWILAMELHCQTQRYLAETQQHRTARIKRVRSQIAATLIQTLKYGWSQPDWLLTGPQVNDLRVRLTNGTFAVLDDHAAGHLNGHQPNRHDAWSLANSLLAAHWLDRSERLRLYNDLSAIAMAEKHPQTAQQYLARAGALQPKKAAQPPAQVPSVVAPTAPTTPGQAPSAAQNPPPQNPMEVLFQKAVSEFRTKDYTDAASDFEQYLTNHQTEHDLSSMYWSWRAYQKLKSPKADQALARLITHYPLSYYGLRARAEAAPNGALTFPQKFSHRVRYVLALSPPQWQAWNRALLLIKAGWFHEAQAELSTLLPPVSVDGDLVFAKIWSEAHDFQTAAQYLMRAFEQDPNTITIAAIQTVYPQEYAQVIAQASHRFGLPAVLVQAVIRQESSYKADAMSSQGAIGLMQLMPVTARQLAHDMHMPLSDLAGDLTEPKINIRLGTAYLHRELHNFNNNLPLALAAYNAGIGNVKTWLHSQPDASAIMAMPSSDPESELWFDELPWLETSHYIKSILRNILFYRMLDHHGDKLDLSKNSVVFGGGF